MTDNFEDGYSEACVRSLSKSLLKKDQYETLLQCSNMGEFMLLLEETDYKPYLISKDGQPIREVNDIKKRLYIKLRDEIEYLMGQASEPLGTFLQMMMHSYQIENVVSFISGMKNQMNPALITASLNPLGEFQGMKSVSTLADGDVVSLFQEILIDLPVGEYFRKFIESIVEHIDQNQGGEVNFGGEVVTVERISNIINEYSSSDIKVFLKKIWLSKYHRWIMANCNLETCEMMDSLLKAEADWETLQIIYNSLSKVSMHDAKGQGLRSKYFNTLGQLYPGKAKALNEVREFAKLQEILQFTPYYDDFQKISDPVAAENEPEMNINSTIDDLQKKHLSERYSEAFFGQFHYGCFYAFLKLKELEISNLVQLAEIYSMGNAIPKNHPAWRKFVPPFQILKDE